MKQLHTFLERLDQILPEYINLDEVPPEDRAEAEDANAKEMQMSLAASKGTDIEPLNKMPKTNWKQTKGFIDQDGTFINIGTTGHDDYARKQGFTSLKRFGMTTGLVRWSPETDAFTVFYTLSDPQIALMEEILMHYGFKNIFIEYLDKLGKPNLIDVNDANPLKFPEKIERVQNKVNDKLLKKATVESVSVLKKFLESNLLEMPAWNDGNKDISKYIVKQNKREVLKGLETRGMDLVEKFKLGEYDVEVWTRGDNIQIHMYDSGLVHIGEFIWYNEDGKWKTESVALAQSAQGKGIAFKIYIHAIENYMHTLYSDTSLTGETGKGSFDVWVKLGNHFQYKYVYNVDEDMLDEVTGFTRDMMGDENVLFVVSVEDIIE